MDLSLGIAILFALILLGSHHLIIASRLNESAIRSLGGGMAASYAFLQLLPELTEESEMLGFSVHIWMLSGFVLFYGLDNRIASKDEVHRAEIGLGNFQVGGRHLHIGIYATYAFLILLGSPFGRHNTIAHALLLVGALGLHFAYKNYCLHKKFGDGFHIGWRTPLACAPLLAWAIKKYSPLHLTMGREIVIAFVAGVVLFNVFREELPSHRQSRYGWFMTGVFVYAAFVGLDEWF